MSMPTKIVDLDEARRQAEEARRFAFYEAWEEAEEQRMDEWYQRVIADEQRAEQFARLQQAAGIPADDQHAVERLRERGLVKIDDNGTVAFRAPGPRHIEGDK